VAVKRQLSVQHSLEIPLPSEAAVPQLLHRCVSCGFLELLPETAAGRFDTCNWTSAKTIVIRFNTEHFK
jgi:hypothetical protein